MKLKRLHLWKLSILRRVCMKPACYVTAEVGARYEWSGYHSKRRYYCHAHAVEELTRMRAVGVEVTLDVAGMRMTTGVVEAAADGKRGASLPASGHGEPVQRRTRNRVQS